MLKQLGDTLLMSSRDKDVELAELIAEIKEDTAKLAEEQIDDSDEEIWTNQPGGRKLHEDLRGVGVVLCDVCECHVDPDVEAFTCTDTCCPFFHANDSGGDAVQELDFCSERGC